MIPRFNYSFTLGDAWTAIRGLWQKSWSNDVYYTTLFPSAEVYELSSARLGIQYALQALQLGDKARVGVQPYTCSSVMLAIEAAGYQAVFIDINQSLTLDCDDLAKKVNGLQALIVTHTFGIPADIDRIKEVIDGLPVIEDCAHAFLSQYSGIQVGNFFEMAVFSFGNGKFPALGSGGLLIVNNKKYATYIDDKIPLLVKNSVLDEVLFVARRFLYSILYSRVGYQLIYRLFSANRSGQFSANPIKETKLYKTAGFLLHQGANGFGHLLSKQKQHALAVIDQQHASFDFVHSDSSGPNQFAIVCLHEQRDILYTHLVRCGIGVGKHFQHAKTWASAFGYQDGECPQFEHLVERLLVIPCHSALTTEDLHIINKSLTLFAGKTSAMLTDHSAYD